MRPAVFVGILLGLLALASPARADWRQFRGPQGAGVVVEGGLPGSLEGGASIAWRVPLPGEGLSGPIVVGDRVYVTCASGPEQSELHVVALAVGDGAVVWERTFWATGRTMHHEKTSVAAPTPCSDGTHLYALFSSNDLVCLDLEGNVRWLRGLTVDYPNASNSLGLASSPMVAGGVLVCLIENDSESFAVGIDPATGTNRWKIPRPTLASWTSPVSFRDPGSGEELVALQGSAGVDAVDPATGSVVWSFGDGAATIPSCALDGERLYVPSHGLTALGLREGGFEKEWVGSALGPGTASPVAGGGKVYVINNAGVLTEVDAASGERGWRVRLEGPFGGSPVLSGSRLLVASERGGLVQLVDLGGDEATVVGTVELGEVIQCTPAVSGGAVYLRSDSTLWKLRARSRASEE